MTATAQADTLSLPQVATRLGKGRTTIWKLASTGQDILPGVRAFKIGSEWRVSTCQLDEFLRTGRVTA